MGPPPLHWMGTSWWCFGHSAVVFLLHVFVFFISHVSCFCLLHFPCCFCHCYSVLSHFASLLRLNPFTCIVPYEEECGLIGLAPLLLFLGRWAFHFLIFLSFLFCLLLGFSAVRLLLSKMSINILLFIFPLCMICFWLCI